MADNLNTAEQENNALTTKLNEYNKYVADLRSANEQLNKSLETNNKTIKQLNSALAKAKEEYELLVGARRQDRVEHQQEVKGYKNTATTAQVHNAELRGTAAVYQERLRRRINNNNQNNKTDHWR